MRLSNLSAIETFVSHTSNALQKSTVSQSANTINLSLSPLSITTILLRGQRVEFVTSVEAEILSESMFKVYPNPVSTSSKVTVEINKSGDATLELFDLNNRIIKTIHRGVIEAQVFKKEVDLSDLPKGTYIFRLSMDGDSMHRKILTF